MARGKGKRFLNSKILDILVLSSLRSISAGLCLKTFKKGRSLCCYDYLIVFHFQEEKYTHLLILETEQSNFQIHMHSKRLNAFETAILNFELYIPFLLQLNVRMFRLILSVRMFMKVEHFFWFEVYSYLTSAILLWTWSWNKMNIKLQSTLQNFAMFSIWYELFV